MRGRSSSKQGKINRVGVSMEKDKVDKVKEEPHLSGAYIRSLVKHLTSTKPKDPFDAGIVNTNGENHHNMKQESPPPPQQPQPPPPPPQIKKQVRRRQHTSRPYQERLLNMAEARREIVTALKFHRASMKQQEAATATATAATTTTATTSSVPHYWAVPTIPPPPLPPLYYENLNFPLPNQTIGLNLNFQDFQNIDANLYQHPLSAYPSSSSSSSSSSFSSSSASSSSSSTSSTAAISAGETSASMPEEVVAGGLHHAMDDDEIEEIKSLGEQHQMEWNDTVNLVMSARWFKFLKTMELGHEETNVDTKKDDFYGFSPFDQITEFPPWLINANDQHFHDHFSDDYFQDPSLSCMDIGEIEGMDDEEWLA
ncbi:hypothetical protein LXL04_003084 [Taraxacum kok-saghyz]